MAVSLNPFPSASLGAIYGTALMVIKTIPAGMIAIAMK